MATFTVGKNVGKRAVAAPAAVRGPVLAPPPPRPIPSTAPCCCPACTELQCQERTRFFAGQLLTEADLNNEQSYLLAKNRLHNRFLHGWGMVCGMQVVCSDCDGWVTIKPGYGIDPCGNDIIVCADQQFNVLKAIQACCTPTKQTANCAPPRSTPPETCKGTEQKWCITIQYYEQPSRMVTPLQPASSKSCSCGCGGGGAGGCGCGGHGSKNGSSHASSSTACGCKSPQPKPSSTTGPASCEPTRIIEGFQFGIVAAPLTEEVPRGPVPGTAAYQMEQCLFSLDQLIQQMPKDFANLSAQAAYTAVCNFLSAVKRYFAGIAITHCQALDQLATIRITQPTQGDNSSGYTQQLQSELKQIVEVVIIAALDCFCMSLIPSCPADPCDNCLCLACVTVKDGKVIDICHFGCRHQLVTFPVLYSWISLLGFDRILRALVRGIESICCHEFQFASEVSFYTGRVAYQKENLTTAGLTNPAMVNRLLSTFLGQNLGSTLLNAAAPQAQAVNLRTFVGQPVELVRGTLMSQGFTAPQITTQAVDGDPSWTAEAVAASADFAPAAVSASTPLTMYTQGNLVVGFDVTDPTESKLQTLQAQVALLQKQVQGMQASHTPTHATPPAKKKH
jgi:hypothetical protein